MQLTPVVVEIDFIALGGRFDERAFSFDRIGELPGFVRLKKIFKALGRGTSGKGCLCSNHDPETVVVADILGTYPPGAL